MLEGLNKNFFKSLISISKILKTLINTKLNFTVFQNFYLY